MPWRSSTLVRVLEEDAAMDEEAAIGQPSVRSLFLM
jgi:hypothetical protein